MTEAPSHIKLVGTFQRDSTVLTRQVIDHLSDGGLREVALMLTTVQIGMSSAGLIRWAILTPDSDQYHGYPPCDMGDLGRCQRVYENSPPWLQARMLPLLEVFREHVAARLVSR